MCRMKHCCNIYISYLYLSAGYVLLFWSQFSFLLMNPERQQMRAPGPLPSLGTCCCSGLLPLALLKPGCFRPLWSEPAEMESISLSSVSFSLLLVKQMKILKNLNKYLSAKTYQMCVFKKKSCVWDRRFV